MNESTQQTSEQPVYKKRDWKKWLAVYFGIAILIYGASYFFYLYQQKSTEGKACGGFAGETGEFACPTGYYCKYTENYPDAQGICVKR